MMRIQKFFKISLIIIVILILVPKLFSVGGIAGFNMKCLGYSFDFQGSNSSTVLDQIYTGYCIGIVYNI